MVFSTCRMGFDDKIFSFSSLFFHTKNQSIVHNFQQFVFEPHKNPQSNGFTINSLIQRKMISRFTFIDIFQFQIKMKNSRIKIGHFLNLSRHGMVKGGYPWTISGAYFIFSDPWPCNLRVGERGWVNWPDASEIESTIESKSSSLGVTYALVWVSGRCPSSLLRPFHFFPFTPPQPRARPPGCAQEHRGPFCAYLPLPRPRFLTLIRFVDSDVCSYDCPCVHLWTPANGNRFLLSFPRNSFNGQ